MKKRQSAGFSLIEGLVILLFISLMLGFSIFISNGLRRRWQMNDTSKEISTIFANIKQRAARNNAPYRLTFTATDYTVQQYVNNAWTNISRVFSNENTIPLATSIFIKAPFPDFAINSMGFLIDPQTPLTSTLFPKQTVILQARNPAGTVESSVNIVFNTYGGIKISK